jgi:phospholipase D1/2
MTRTLQVGKHIWRTHVAEEVGLLIDAEDYYRSFYYAARTAKKRLLISGWQFDSDVALLRGAEAERAPAPVEFLKFLNSLCEAEPELQIRILAWDFHLVFAIEREWMQKLVFHWSTHERIEFKFDDSHVDNGSHHQKFAVIDDRVAFLGGLDICDHRWDDRRHENKNPLRLSRGQPHKPFHDIQVYLSGREIARSLTELWHERWVRAGGEPLDLNGGTDSALDPRELEGLVAFGEHTVSLSRTDPHGSPGGPVPCTEIRDLHVDAIHAAERSIYIETQYFSSRAVADALVERMQASSEPRLEIVLVLNMKGETLKEQAAVGLAQAQQIDRLRKVAASSGHALGVYYSLPACEPGEEPEQATYIHSKLMIVDDRLLTVGSANCTNRSMSVDTELNCNLQAESAETALAGSIRKLRGLLLAEHSGGDALERVEGLVDELDGFAERAARRDTSCPCRLRRHPSPTDDEKAALALIDPQALPFDPDGAESMDEDKTIFVGGLGNALRALLGMVAEKL